MYAYVSLIPNVNSDPTWCFMDIFMFNSYLNEKSEYDQEIPQSHTADQPTASWGRATEH